MLLALLALLIAVTFSAALAARSPEAVAAARERRTQAALARAADALVAHALRYRDEQAAQGQPDRVYGYLPLPDLGSTRNNNTGCTLEGCDAANFAGNALGVSVLGRLPWRTLGLPPLRDGHGECLWYAVSASHQRQQRLAPMNWDSAGHFAIAGVTAVSPHAQLIAIVFSAGPPLPGQERGRRGGDATNLCGGNYDAANYLEAANRLGGMHGATAATDATNARKMFTLPGPGDIHGNAGANDRAQPLGADRLFAALRASAAFRADIDALLDRIVACLAGQAIPPGYADRLPEDTCYDDSQTPRGYFSHVRDQLYLARPTGNFTVNGRDDCAAALLFAGQRAAHQRRFTPQERADATNYLEGANRAGFGAATAIFTGAAHFDRAPPQAPEQDIVRCIPAGAPFVTVSSPALAATQQLAVYDATTRTLVLGRENVVTGTLGNALAPALFGCAWLPEARTLGGGLRVYFRFRFRQTGTNVGSNGFVFVLADAQRNGTDACGAAGSHLGYSGINPHTPPLLPPKIGIEFDQSRDTGFPGSGGETAQNAGRNDPCGTTGSGCAGLGYNSHVAILYWGNTAANAADGVAQPGFDDNVHGFPANSPAADAPPRNPQYPSPGLVFRDLRGKTAEGGDSHLYHVRVELDPLPATAPGARLRTRVWMLADSATVANRIAAMQNTTRPMTQLAADFAPLLEDTANFAAADALRSLRPGFANAQRTTDQEVRIADFAATWLPALSP